MNWIMDPIDGYDILTLMNENDCPNYCNCSSGLMIGNCSCSGVGYSS